MIQNKAMLANLSISRWAARKTDKKVSKEVTQSHGATADSGDFRKSLVDKAHLQALQTSESTIRAFHYKLTLPWDDDGDRMLPSALFQEYTDQMRNFKLADEKLRREFFAIYPQLVAQARTRLGSMYDPADFPDPSRIPEKFGIKITMKPIPSASDFRVDINNEAAEEIREQITAENDAKFQAAMKECFKRVEKVVTRISETLHQEEPRIFDSMISNARDLVACLPGLNLTADPALEELRLQLDDMLVHPDSLRAQPHIRAKTADAADAILAKMKHYVV